MSQEKNEAKNEALFFDLNSFLSVSFNFLNLHYRFRKNFVRNDYHHVNVESAPDDAIKESVNP